jgi:hypothetical protein
MMQDWAGSASVEAQPTQRPAREVDISQRNPMTQAQARAGSSPISRKSLLRRGMTSEPRPDTAICK